MAKYIYGKEVSSSLMAINRNNLSIALSPFFYSRDQRKIRDILCAVRVYP